MGIKEIRQANLKILLRKCPLQKDFADKVGVAPNIISQIKNGEKMMGSRVANRIEAALDLGHGWMDTSRGDNEESGFTSYNISLITQRQVHTYITQRNWVEPQIKPTTVSFDGPPNRYAILVEDDSMTPALPAGCKIAVDPDSQPVRGKPAVYSSKEGGTLIGRYMEMNRGKYLTFDNPRYPTAEILPDSIYCGLVTHRLTEEI